MTLFGLALCALLAAVAWHHSEAHPRHRPVAWLVTVAFVSDALHLATVTLVLAPVRAQIGTAPFAGWARVAFHVQQAAFLAFPACLAAVAALVFLEAPRRRRAAALAAGLWCLAVLALTVAYPMVRGRLLFQAYACMDVAVLAGTIAAGVEWTRRREQPTLTEGNVLALGIIKLGALAAWLTTWDFAVGLHVTVYGALVALHMGELWLGSSRASSSG